MLRNLFLILMLVALTSCADGRAKSAPAASDEWRSVLATKKAAIVSDDLALRQRYADQLLGFIRRHPDHARAREVYDDLELSFARELAARGEYAASLRYYDDILERRPDAADIAAERAEVKSRTSVDTAELARLERGMTTREVEQLLGRPPRGWQRTAQKERTRYESWFYRTGSGEVIAIHFDSGRVFAVDPPKSGAVAPKS